MAATDREERRLVQALRERILTAVENDPSLRSDCILSLLMNRHHVPVRFLRRKRWDLDRATAQVIRALKWATDINLDRLKLADFPREAYILAPFIVYKTDFEGNPVGYAR